MPNLVIWQEKRKNFTIEAHWMPVQAKRVGVFAVNTIRARATPVMYRYWTRSEWQLDCLSGWFKNRRKLKKHMKKYGAWS